MTNFQLKEFGIQSTDENIKIFIIWIIYDIQIPLLLVQEESHREETD